MDVFASIPHAKQFAEARRLIEPRVFRRLAASALNDSARFTITQANRAIRAELPLRVKDVKKLFSRKAKAAAESLHARVEVVREGVPMKRYRARGTNRPKKYKTGKLGGVKVTPRKGGGRELLRNSFVGKSTTNNEGKETGLGGHVFRRVPGKFTRMGKPAIEKVFGPTVVGVLAGKPGMLKKIEDSIPDHTLGRLESKIRAHFAGVTFIPKDR
jgi:hypothetical protein